MDIVLVAAIGSNGELGRNNKLLWHLPGDLPRFKQMTLGHPIIMGRKTFDSIGKALPGRLNIVLTANKDWQAKGVEVADSPQSALDIAQQNNSEKIFVIGGGQIYKLFLPYATQLELTEVADAPVADAFFPNFSAQEFKQTARISNQHQQLQFDYVSYQRL